VPVAKKQETAPPGWKSWWNETQECLRILAAPLIVFLFCKLMRWSGMSAPFIDFIEMEDENAAVLIFTAYLVANVRRAILRIFL
jgi:hypothetical protein